MWVVTWEAKKTGEWVSDPERFRTKRDAIKYMQDVADIVLPENRNGLYQSKRVSISSNNRVGEK